LLAGLIAIAAVYFFTKGDNEATRSAGTSEAPATTTTIEDTVPLLPDPASPELAKKGGTGGDQSEPDVEPEVASTDDRVPEREGAEKVEEPVKKPAAAPRKPATTDTPRTRDRAEPQAQTTASTGVQYKVRSKAYFHNEPDENTRRNAFIVHWNNAVLKPLEVKNDFVYIVFTNHLGQTSRGWLRVKDLVKVEPATH
jgi:serine/threonine-protein kinase